MACTPGAQRSITMEAVIRKQEADSIAVVHDLSISFDGEEVSIRHHGTLIIMHRADFEAIAREYRAFREAHIAFQDRQS